MYKIYQYNDNDFRIICSKYQRVNKETKERVIKYSQDVEEKEQLRAKRKIREYILSNDFKYFFTSTVNSELCDRFNLEACQKRIRRSLVTIKTRDNSFKYIFITECHKDGAFHFHGVCNDLPLYINSNGFYSSKDFDKLGFNSFSPIKDKTKCANYITKYITKNCIRNERGSIYFCSNGLKTAFSYEIKPIDFDNFVKHIYTYKNKSYHINEFCKIIDFRLQDQNSEQILFLQNSIQEMPTLIDILKSKFKSEHY